jgi:hypothetical protein
VAQIQTVKAKQVRVGDTLAHGDLMGDVVTDVAHASGRVVITARRGRREYQIPADANDRVDIARD